MITQTDIIHLKVVLTLEIQAAILIRMVRNMMCCAVNGQGAGVVAAISIQTNVTVADVDIKRVQEQLLKQGARIH